MKKIIYVLLVLLVLTGCSGTSEKETLYDKYETTITALENGNFDEAIGIINSMKAEKMKEEAGDINDYLIEVEIDENNISEYFEPISFAKYNEFGEIKENSVGFGFRSKKYDEGLIIYKVDEGIAVELDMDGMIGTDYLTSLLSCGNGRGGGSVDADNFKITFTGRVIGGKITFIKQEYVNKYETEKPINPSDMYKTFDIELLNGEKIYRNGNPNYLY